MIDINNFVAGYAGKHRGQVSNPCMTAREAIQLADQIAALQAAFEKARTDANTSQHQVEALQARVQELEEDAMRYRKVRRDPAMLLHLRNSEFDAAIDALPEPRHD